MIPRKLQIFRSRGLLLAAGYCLAGVVSQGGSSAQVIFVDAMSYSSNSAIQAVWKRATSSGGSATRGTTFTAATVAGAKTPLSSPYLSLANGLTYVDLPTTVQGDFRLKFKMLDTSYSRFSHLAIMDASGRYGYGVHWDTNNYNQASGRGTVSLTKLAFASAWASSGYASFGTKLVSANSNHPATGYAVTNPANPPTYSTTFQDFAAFELTWKAATGQFTLRQNGQVLLTFTDTTYKNFKRLYFAGNTTSALDDVSLSLTAPPSWPPAFETGYGAQVPFVTLEAESPANTVSGGSIVTATRAQLDAWPPTAAVEASGRSHVELKQAGDYVQFPNVPQANTLVIRHCIPDSPAGDGISATLGLYVNGQRRQSITLTSKYNWLYDPAPNDSNDNGQDNTPGAEPHVYWDETRVFITGGVQAGDSVRLQKDAQDTASYYRIDLIDLEQVGGPLPQPANSLSVTTYGANGSDTSDDSTAFTNCINAARTQGRIVWIPAGKYHLGIAPPALNGVKVQGAGMWYTEIYHNATNSGTFKIFSMTGNGSSVSDLFIDSLTETNRSTNVVWPFSGVGTNWSVQNCWMTHSGVGFWISGFDGKITNCRVRFTYADGININNGSVLNTGRVLVENNHVRSAGDDSIAILSLENDVPGETHNVTVRNNTTVCPWWGSSLALGGGSGHVIENNALLDGAGFVLNLPMAYKKYPITSAVFRRNLLNRCGRNIGGQRRGAIWSNPDYTTISGMLIEENLILNALYRGIHFAGSKSQEIVFRGNLIDAPYEAGVYVNSTAIGGAVLDSNRIQNLRSGQPTISNTNTSGNFTITQIGATPYYPWKFDRFSVAELADMTVSGNKADPDGDGRPNFSEYGLGGLPKTADAAATEPVLGVANDRLLLTYFLPDGRDDLEYEVEWSSDLLTWNTEASHVEAAGTAPAAGGTLVTVRTVQTLDQAPRQYLRVRIRKP